MGSQVEELGNEIRRRRRQKGMTQQQLASIIGKDPSYISKIESGRLDPDKEGPSEPVVRKLAEQLTLDNESIDEVFNFFMTYLGKLPKEIQKEIVGIMSSKPDLTRPKTNYESIFKKMQINQKTLESKIKRN